MHSSERTGTDFSAVSISHTSLARVFCVFSSEARDEFFRFLQSITLSPTLMDPTLVSVVRAVDGQDTGLSAQPTSDRHRPGFSSSERTGPGFSAFKASAQKNATSDIISSQPIACPSDQSRSRSHVFTDQEGRKCVCQNSRLLRLQSLLCRPGLVVGSGVLWTVKLPVKHHTKNANTDVISSQPIVCPSEQSRSRSHVFSPTKKVGSVFFRTRVYCGYSPCLADPASLSVVGFVYEQNTAHLHV